MTLGTRLTASFDAIAHNAITWLLMGLIFVFGVPSMIWLMSPSTSQPFPQIQTLASEAAAKIADLTGQAESLKSQLDANTRELDAEQHKLQDAQNRLALVPISPPIDILSGQQKTYSLALGKCSMLL